MVFVAPERQNYLPLRYLPVQCNSIGMLNKWVRYFFLALLPILLIYGCEEDDPSVNAGRLRVKLTDATDITIKELYFHIQEISVFVTDTTNSEGEWRTLEFNGGEYNLLKLFNGKSVQIVDQFFPAGKAIQKIRLVPGHNNRFLTNIDKEPSPLQLPGEIVNGVEIELPEPIILMPNIISSLVIDVNAAQSIRNLNGNNFFYPTIRAFPESYGSKLQGQVSPAEFTAAIAVILEPDTLWTVVEPDGSFSFSGLEKGEWEVYLFAHPASLYTDTAFTWNVDTTGLVSITPRPIKLPVREKTTNGDD